MLQNIVKDNSNKLKQDTNSIYRRTRMYTGVEDRHFEKLLQIRQLNFI